MINTLLADFVWHGNDDWAPDLSQAEAAYEAGIEAFLQQDSCPFPGNSALQAQWRRGFEDARRDLSSVWRDATPATPQPEIEALVRVMSPSERRAMIAWLSSGIDPVSG